TNEAYKALLQEIANAEAEAAKAEDAELEVMMAGDELDRRVKHAEANLREAEAAVAADRKKLESQILEQKVLLEEGLAARDKAIAPVPEDLRDLYDRIAKRHHGAALARVRDNQCQGCGLRILPHVVQLLHRDDDHEVHRCENCGLILYSLEPIIAQPPTASGSAAAS